MGKIFISYARADDEPFVKQLYQDLTERGFDIWWDRKAMESRGLTFLQEIRDAIEGSDRLIAVIGPNAVKSEYVNVEWEHALLFSKGVIPILRKGFELPGKNDYDIVPPKLSKFDCPDFRKERSYQDALEELVRKLKTPVPPLGDFRTAVPSLPAHFLPRSDELVLLGNAVLSDIKRPEVVNSARQKTVIVGMGGMGKSVLSAAFARSTETRRAFTDGIVWISIGQDPDLLSNVRQFGLAFNDKMENYVDIKTARDKLPGMLADKVCLIVLDDIWNVAHAEHFINALGPRCRLLITTRDGGIASAIEANEHRLGVLTDAAALRFLATWCGKEVDSLPHEAVAVATECGTLPFALALCGAMARDGTSWPDMLDALKEADLTFIEKKFPNYPYTDVLKSLKISVDTLANEDPEAVKQYQKLVVFYSHKKIPEAAIMTLWMHMDGLKERNARKLLTTLNSKALLTLEGESPQRFATLHDMQHDYLRAIRGDQKKLHTELLEAYQEECKNGWPGGPNDGYFFENLAYHLVEAGRKEELQKLLFDFGWIHAKLEATDFNILVGDYNLLQEDRQLQLVKGALDLSAHVLNLDKTQLAGQLLGRLQSFHGSEMQSLIEKARCWKGSIWLHPLNASLKSPEDQLILNPEAHTGRVNMMAITPDGRYSISSSFDRTIRVWDIEKGKQQHILKGHKNRVWAVAATPDSKSIISASSDCTLKVWDILTGENITTLEGHDDSVIAVALTPFGQRAISASRDKTLKVWDMKAWCICHTLKHDDVVRTVVVTPDSCRAISGSDDKTLKIWDLESGTLIHTFEGHKDKVWAVAVTQDGKRAVSGSNDKTLKVWDIENMKQLHTLEGHKDWITSLIISKDGNYVISASADNRLKVWDIIKGKELHTLEGHNSLVTSVAIIQESESVISASLDNTLKVWNIKNGKIITGFSGDNPFMTCAVSLDRRTIVAGDKSGCVHILRLEGAS